MAAYTPVTWTTRLCQRRADRPRHAARPDLARDARPLRRLGLDLPRDRRRGRHDPAVPDGGGPLPDRRLVLLAWSIAREGRPSSSRRRREWRDSAIVGALLLGGGMGMVAFGEQTVPSGITALLIAMMPVWVAILGRIFLGERLPRLAVVGIASASPVSRSSPVRPSGRQPARSIRSAGRLSSLSPIAWSAGSLFASHRAVAARPTARGDGRSRCCSAGWSSRRWPRSPASLRRSMRRRSRRDSIIAFAYLTIIGSLLAFTVYGWHAARRAAPAGRHLRVRQPGRRGHPRRAGARRADRRPDGRRRRRDRLRGRPDRHGPGPDARDQPRSWRPPAPPLSPRSVLATPPRLPDPTGQDAGRSQPCAGHGSQRSGRSSR